MLTQPSESLAAADAKLRKRLLTREYVRRNYAKVKNTMETLRRQLQALEAQYHELLDQSARLVANDPSSSKLLKRYKRLALARQELYEENQALHDRIASWMMYEAQVQQELDKSQENVVPVSVFLFRAPTREQCRRALAGCRDDALRYLATANLQSTGVTFFGWKDRRQVTGERLAFSFEKVFRHHTPRDLLDRTWGILEDPDKFRLMYSTSLNVHFRPLQQIGKDTVLLYWHLQPEDMPVVLRTVFLMARITIPGGYMIASRAIDKDAIGFDETGLESQIDTVPGPFGMPRTKIWATFDIWIVALEHGPDASRIIYGGYSFVSVWNLEVLLMCMRWESVAMGARLLPPS